VFERFTEPARQVVLLAQEEARALRHHSIGTEHLLLGVLREEDGIGARALRSLDVAVEACRDALVALTPRGEDVAPARMPFTPSSKKVLEKVALHEALSLGHDYIAGEHILLALVRESEGLAARILLELGAGPEKVRNEVMRMLTDRQSSAGGRMPAVSGGLPATLFDQAYAVLDTLFTEIQERLGRPADAGDLLLVLASLHGGVVSSALEAVGIDMKMLAHAVEEARSEGSDPTLVSALTLSVQIDEARREKEEKVEAQEWEAAAHVRDRERALTKQLEQSLDEALDRVRRHLGLGERLGGYSVDD
jgi:ATP-dependent Clp protease ATP-binding subunit ClpA